MENHCGEENSKQNHKQIYTHTDTDTVRTHSPIHRMINNE